VLQREQPDDGGSDGDVYHLVYVGRSSWRIERDYGDRLEELVREGFDVHVLAAADGGFAALAERGIHGRDIPVARSGNVAGLVGAFFIVQAYLIEHQPLLVHGYDGPVAWLAALAADRVDTPAIFATIEGHPAGGRGRRPWEVGPVDLRLTFPGLVETLESQLGRPVGSAVEAGARAMSRGLAERVDRYLVTTEREFDMLEQTDWMPGHKLEIVVGGRGIDVDRFHVEHDQVRSVDEARRELQIPADWRHVVGYAGPLRPDRGGLDSLRVLDRTGGHGDIGWAIAPAGGAVNPAFRARLESRIDRGDDIVLVDGADRPALYRALDLVASPRVDASVSPELMRAQAMSVPAVAFDSAASAAVVANGHTGRLVAPGDIDQFTRVLRGLLDDPKRMRDFGVRARSRATSRFDRQQVDGQVMRIYDTILEQQLES